MVVVLPAPLPPTNPVSRPLPTVNPTSWSTRRSPKCFVTPAMVSIVVPLPSTVLADGSTLRAGRHGTPPAGGGTSRRGGSTARGSRGRQLEAVMPRSNAHTTAWIRSRTPVFWSTFDTWVFTVASPT